MDDCDQAEVESHVAVQDVAELVGNDALELVAAELLGAAAGQADHRLLRPRAGGEGVDALLVVHHEDRRHRQPGGERHLLDNVEHLPLERVGRVGRQATAAEREGQGLASAGQLRRLVKAAGPNHSADAEGDGRKHLGPPERRNLQPDGGFRGWPRRFAGHEDRDHQAVGPCHEPDHRHHEERDQAAGVATGPILMLEEVHRRGVSEASTAHWAETPTDRSSG